VSAIWAEVTTLVAAVLNILFEVNLAFVNNFHNKEGVARDLVIELKDAWTSSPGFYQRNRNVGKNNLQGRLKIKLQGIKWARWLSPSLIHNNQITSNQEVDHKFWGCRIPARCCKGWLSGSSSTLAATLGSISSTRPELSWQEVARDVEDLAVL